MADYIVVIKSTIALTGGRAFFVPAGFTWRNMMNEVTEKRTAGDVYDDLTLKMGHIHSLLDIMATCDRSQCDVQGAAYAIQGVVEDANVLLKEFHDS